MTRPEENDVVRLCLEGKEEAMCLIQLEHNRHLEAHLSARGGGPRRNQSYSRRFLDRLPGGHWVQIPADRKIQRENASPPLVARPIATIWGVTKAG